MSAPTGLTPKATPFSPPSLTRRALAEIVYRPRSATEILDASFRVLRDHYSSFVTLAGVAYFPLAVFTLIFRRYVDGASDDATMAYSFSMIILMIIQLVWFQVMNAVMSILASRAYLREDLDPGSSWTVVLPRLLWVIGTGIIVTVSAAFGFVFLIFPAVYVYTRYGLGPLIAALEGTSMKESLARSTFLSEGRKVHIFVVSLLTLLLYFIMSIGLAALSTMFSSLLVQTAFSFLSTILVWPLLPMVWTVLYYDLRIRAEGYDVDLMSRQLDDMPAPATSLT